MFEFSNACDTDTTSNPAQAKPTPKPKPASNRAPATIIKINSETETGQQPRTRYRQGPPRGLQVACRDWFAWPKGPTEN